MPDFELVIQTDLTISIRSVADGSLMKLQRKLRNDIHTIYILPPDCWLCSKFDVRQIVPVLVGHCGRAQPFLGGKETNTM
jgi:hypothetical protein